MLHGRALKENHSRERSVFVNRKASRVRAANKSGSAVPSRPDSIDGKRREPVLFFYEAHSSSGLVASVEFRKPAPGASKHEPLLIVTLRDGPVRLRDLSHKYGQGRITDISHHHPLFVGYTYVVHGREVAFKIDSKSERALGFSIDYSVGPHGNNKGP